MPQTLIPFRWPAAWCDPAPIELIKPGPINCVFLQPGPIADAVRAAGLTVRFDDSPSPESLLADAVWPCIKRSAAGARNDADAGPTGAPWIDSNSWAARLAAVRNPGKPVWLAFHPPTGEPAPAQADYIIALADSYAAAARWIVSLDDTLAASLVARHPQAMATWREILKTIAFFEKHADWSTWTPASSLGILSTFTGKDQFMGHEVLNLAARRNLLYRILDRNIPATHDFDSLRAILYVDFTPPDLRLRERLTAFIHGGGLLIAPPPVARRFPMGHAVPCPVAGYDLRSVSKGFVAAAESEWEDPYFLAAEVHSLVSRRNDPVRLFNGASLWNHFTVPLKGNAALLQMVSFTSRPNASVAVAPARPWRSALFHTLAFEIPATLEPTAVDGRREFHLPPFSYYAALEFRP